MTEKPFLIVLCGMPASGKSTFVKSFTTSVNKKFKTISSDDIIEQVARSQKKTYTEIFETHAKKASKLMNEKAAEAFKNKDNIIWDQTNLTAKKRKKILQKADGYTKIVMFFYVEDAVMYKRLYLRNFDGSKFIPENVLNSMKSTAEVPKILEGFDYIFRPFEINVLTKLVNGEEIYYG